MQDKLEDIAWAGEQPWEESLALTSSAPVAVENVDDDLERELAFYNQARPNIMNVLAFPGANSGSKAAVAKVKRGRRGMRIAAWSGSWPCATKSARCQLRPSFLYFVFDLLTFSLQRFLV